jgi:septal ring factor EnvC (AmiA/AmiB activator)
MSRSEWVSTLPLWRRLLAMFNWRPVYDIEQQTKQHELSELESEKRLQQLKSETEQIKSETEQIKNEAEQIKKEAEQIKKETEQIRQENKRLAGLNSRMDALLRNADSSSQIPPATDSN